MTNSMGVGMNYVEQFYSTNIKLRAFEDALAETMVLIQIFVTICRYRQFNSESMKLCEHSWEMPFW